MPDLKSCTSAKQVKAKAKVATYRNATATVVATTVVAHMRSEKDAKKVVASRRTELKCGTLEAEGLSATFTAGPKIKLGQESVSQHMTIDGLPTQTDLVTIHKGSRIIIVGLISVDGNPAGDLAPLAKKAFKVGL